jgi:transposase-like protein
VEDYPRNLPEFEERFATEAACLAYLVSWRWPEGFVCPQCAGREAWQTQRGLWHCRGCRKQTSVTAGTIFHGSRKPLRLWFRALWYITNQKFGAKALGVQRVLGLGSYHTAWAWLHRLRRAMVRPGRERLSGVVQLDETFLGGPRAGQRGRGAAGKTLVAIAVEQASPQGAGRLRLAVIPDASAASLTAVATAQIVPGTTVQTDDWKGYGGLPAAGYPRQVLSPEQLELPQLVAALLKRWRLGTYQGAVRTTHLAYYLDEFTFRFNRRSSRHRGKLFYRLVQQAAIAEPVAGDRLKAAEPAADGADYDDLAF